MDHLIEASTDAHDLTNDSHSSHLSHFAHVRLYPSSPGRVTLQVRSQGRTTPHGKTARRVVSSARLDAAQAQELRNALDAWLETER